MNLEETIQKIIVDCLGLDEQARACLAAGGQLFVPNEHGGLGLDSIASLEIIAALSDELDLPFDDLGTEDLASVPTIAAYVARQRAEG